MKLFAALVLVVGLFGVASCPGSAAPQSRTCVAPPTKLTLLNDVGRLSRDVPASEVLGWRRLLRSSHLSAKRAARLHLWFGEIEIARNREPERALWHFRQAQLLARRSDPVYGHAGYDRAMTLFFQGAYTLAADAFHSLLQPKAALNGCSHRDCALWYRHAAACAGYHAQHAKLGITEPPRLDPRCGVAALAACLKAHGRPYDRKTLLSHCRMTGLGNNMQDLLDGARRLGMSAWAVKADDEGLQTLPKPLVAYVEGDHFVAVTRADRDGVSYLCSDCGAWPGGRRDLTWKQWRAMDCDLYLVVTHQGDRADTTLRLPFHGQGVRKAASLSSSGKLAMFTGTAPASSIRSISFLGAHIKLFLQPVDVDCSGSAVGSLHEPPDTNCSCDSSGNAPGATSTSSGALDGDPVNLATGEEEYRPEPDLVVYNPIGPSVVWRRLYGSLRDLQGNFQLAFGYGWNTGYDMQVVSAGGLINLYLPNGSSYPFGAPPTPTPSNPQVSCPAAISGLAMLCTWLYNQDGTLSFVFTRPDRSQWIFSNLDLGTGYYCLTRLVDRNGNYINFVYNSLGANSGFQLAAITDSNNVPLLTIMYNASRNITSVSDRYHRSVYYQVRQFKNPSLYGYQDELVQVSQIVRTGSLQHPIRYAYGYVQSTGDGHIPFLHTITVPSATGIGTSTATIYYSRDGFVDRIIDANGNIRSYGVVDENDTRVTVTDSHYKVLYSYTVSFDNQMRTVSRTDGTNQVAVYQAAYHPDNAYQPYQVTDGNNNTTTTTYDSYGQVETVTTPRNVTTTYTRDYSLFPLGELQQIQEGSKSPMSFTYYEPSGLVQTITTPTPGTAGASGGVTTSFAYDGLGNLLSIQRPGNGTAATITTTLNYTQDGSYSQADAIGQPLTVTDNLGHITHFRYDWQGNQTTQVDALGNLYANQYDIANHVVRRVAPAIGDVTSLLSVSKSQLIYNGTTKTYNGTITLTNVSTQNLQGSLLLALTNLAPGVTLANAAGTYVNSPALLSRPVTLASGAKTTLNVRFAAPSASAVSYGAQIYLTNGKGNPAVTPSETRTIYLYPGGPLRFVNTLDETGALTRQVAYGYGKEGELLSVSGSTEPVTYTYDAAYRLQTLADGNGNATHYAYNQQGWLRQVTYPMGDNVQYSSYDPMGHVLKRIDGRGIETDYTYNDPESKLTNVAYINSANYPNVSQYGVSIGYDGYGRTQDVYDFSGHTHLDYDDLDTQTEIDTTYNDANGHPLPTVSLTYGLNPDASRQSMTVQTSTTSYDFTYGYDAADRPQSLTNPFNETTQWSYLNNNWLASQQDANGVVCQYAYNRRGFLNDLTHYAPTGSLLSDFGAMAYDAVANRLTKSVTIPAAPSGYSGQTAYTYDIKDQLRQEQSTLLGGYTENFNYDPAGNPFSFKGQSHNFNADNQFTNSGFAYDGEGNPTTYNGTALSFDPEDHMTSFGNVLTAGYRADGLRAWKQTTNGRTYFIYDGITPVFELDGSGNETAVNTFGTNGLLSRYTNASSTFYTFDPQGSVSQQIDHSGDVLASFTLDTYGTRGVGSGSDPLSGFGSQVSYYADWEAEIYVLGYRYYDPQLGRFITRDPIRYRGGPNIYTYVRNNPANKTDATGLYVECWYSQTTGSLVCYDSNTGNEVGSGSGYAGGNKGHSPFGINDPDLENLPDIGPLPRGGYIIGAGVLHPGSGGAFPWLPLSPVSPNPYDRGGFLIHPDNRRHNFTASRGCITLNVRNDDNSDLLWWLYLSGGGFLHVTE